MATIAIDESNAVGVSKNTWQSEYWSAWRCANRAPAQFRQVVEAHGRLVRQNNALAKQKASAETQLLILQHESTTTSSAKAQQQLEARIRELQEELLGKGKLDTEVAELRFRVLSAEKDKEEAQRGFEALKLMEVGVKTERDALEATRTVLTKELEATRKTLSDREQECDKLRLENGDLVMRLLEDKASMVGEMNKMNEEVEGLQRQLKEHQHAASRRDNSKETAATPSTGHSAGGGSGGGGQGWSLSNDYYSSDTSGSGFSAVSPPTRLKHHVKAHHTEVNCVGYSKADPLLFTGSSDGTVKVWSSSGGSSSAGEGGDPTSRPGSGGSSSSSGGSSSSSSLRAKATLRDGSGASSGSQAVLSLDSTDGFVVGASTDRTIKVWDLKTERLRASLTGHSNKVHAVKFLSSSSNTLVTGSTDRTLMVFDCRTNRAVKCMKASSTCNAVDVGSDGGNTVVSGHQDGSVRLWDLRSGLQVAEASEAHGNAQVTSVAFSPRGGMQILSAGRDNALRLLDARTLAPSAGALAGGVTHSSLRIGYNWSRAAWSPNGSFMLCGSLNGSVLLWDLSSNAQSTSNADGGAAAAAAAAVRAAASVGGGGGERGAGGGRGGRRGSSGGGNNNKSAGARQEGGACDVGDAGGGSSGGGGVGRWNRFGAALGHTLGGALGQTIGGTGLGTALGNTLGGTIGNRLTESDTQEHTDGSENIIRESARCHKVLTGGHDAPVTSVAWAPGVGGWNQVASVDKSGSLCIWD